MELNLKRIQEFHYMMLCSTRNPSIYIQVKQLPRIRLDYTVNGYRNWPRYGLRWSGLCWHSRHSTSGAGRRAAACGLLHECCTGNGSTNHDSADRMSGQFLFYHENEAMHNDKYRDDHDYEPPCWNALADNVIVMMKASIDTASE